jgi:fumarylacetoacetate (FAA) hydrolase
MLKQDNELASLGAELLPGDVIGSGTVGSGSLLELTRGDGPWLQPGDVVELEVEGIGILRNTVIAQPQASACVLSQPKGCGYAGH